MSLRTVIGGIGAIVGGIIGGPFGAQLGWALGGIAGNMIDPQVVKGPSIGDVAVQTSAEGGPIPIVYGTSPPLAGNVIADGGPNIVTNRRRAGKGGPKYETESVYRTYAVGICEGPINGIVRVWRNSKLVYDVSETPLVSDEDNDEFLETARFFLGAYDQNPSPDLEAIFGVGETAAHRGIAYMVLADENVTDLGGAWAQWMFQVDKTSPLLIQAEHFEGGKEIFFTGTPTSLPLPDGFSPDQGGALFVFMATDNDSRQIASVTWSGYALTKIAELTSVKGETIDEVPHSNVRTWLYALALEGLDLTNTTLAFTASGDPVIGHYDAHFFTRVHQDDVESPYDTDEDSTAPTTSRPVVTGQMTCASEDRGIVMVMMAADSRGAVDDLTSPQVVEYPTGIAFTSSMGSWGDGGLRENGHVTFSFGENVIDSAGQYYVARNASTTIYPDDTFGITAKVMSFRCSVAEAAPQIASLKDIITDVCRRAGVESSNIDVSLLPNVEVAGITVTNQYAAAEILISLGQIYLFDVSAYEDVIHFIPRGGNSVATLTEDEMVDDGPGDVDESSRKDSIIIPRTLHLNYYDIDTSGLNTGKQSSDRPGDRRAVGERSLQTPVLMTAELAAHTVDIQHKIMIEEAKGEFRFSVPDNLIALTPADPIIVQWSGRSERMRIIQVDIHDGYQTITCVRDRQSAYTSTVEALPLPPPTAPPSSIPGPTLLRVLDIHILRDVDDNVGLAYYIAIAGTTAAWSGALVELSYDGGVNYVADESISVGAVIGTLDTALNDHPAEFPDETNSCAVNLLSWQAELSETDLEGMLNGQNLAAIDGELVNFANADQESSGYWLLSHFLRGRKGTEPVTHAFGAKFTLLNRPSLTLIPASITDIGRTMTFRATSFGAASITGTVVSIVYTGMTQTERAASMLSVYRDTDDLVCSWNGVGRLGSGVAAAHGVRFTGYRVTFDDGVAAPIVVDTVAETLVQDVSTLSSPVTVSVVQLNSLTGAGPSIEVIVA